MQINQKIARALTNVLKIITSSAVVIILCASASLWSADPNALKAWGSVLNGNSHDSVVLQALPCPATSATDFNSGGYAQGSYALPAADSLGYQEEQGFCDDGLFGGPINNQSGQESEGESEFFAVVAGACIDCDAEGVVEDAASGGLDAVEGPIAVSGKRKQNDDAGDDIRTGVAQPKAKKACKDNKHQCDWAECDYATNNLGNLKIHMRKHTGEKPFVCDFPGCGYEAGYQSTLARHARTHTGEKPFVCEHEGCNYAAAQAGNLKIHRRRIHTGETPHACDFPGCGYAATHASNLTVHRRTHTRERTFKCDFAGCDYAAVQASSLTVHARTHTRERTFKCDFAGCDYATAQAGSLKAHARIHAGETPYLCYFAGCGHATTSASDLNKHERTHGNRKFICKRCNYTTPQANDYDKHLKGCKLK